MLLCWFCARLIRVTYLYSLASRLNGKSASTRLFEFIGNIHDIESFYGNPSTFGPFSLLFLSHWSHLSTILLWSSGNLFHIGWSGNFSCWLLNPPATLTLSHVTWDPLYQSFEFYNLSSSPSSLVSYSGLYHWMYTVGFRSEYLVYLVALAAQLISLLPLLSAKLHSLYFFHSTIWSKHFSQSTYSLYGTFPSQH